MTALGPVVRSGLHRRWVQTVVITLATAAAVTSGVLGLGLLVASNAPFDRAFAAQHGAHLTLLADASKVTTDRLAATADLDGVAETAGPFRTAQVMVLPGSPPGETTVPEGARGPVLTVVARTGPGTGVDRLTLTEGRWAREPGEVVMSTGGDFRMSLGSTLVLGSGADAVSGTVVGLARSVSATADAWVSPDGLDALPASSPGYQVLYRLDDADTADVTAARSALRGALPEGAVTGARSWLAVKQDAGARTSLFVPILLMFGGLSLLLSVLVVGTVVAGAVGSTIRRIGVLKALGSTPLQVVVAYVAQVLVPATAGALVGLVVGNLVAVPLLADTEDLYGTVELTIAPWVDAVVLLGVLAVVTLTASAAAGRAGRLSSVAALAVGRTPPVARGQRAARVAARLPLPRPVTLGLVRPFGAPARAVAMVLAVAFGAAAVTVATGLAASLSRVQAAADHAGSDVVVDGSAGGPPGRELSPRPGTGREPVDPADPERVAAALEAQPGTAHWLGRAEEDVVVPGLTGDSSLVELTGDPGWLGYELVTGRWATGPEEAVVPTGLLRSTDREVGDTLTLTRDGGPVTLTIVGEVFDPGDDGQVLTRAGADAVLTTWLVGVADGTDPGAYAAGLQDDLDALGLTAHVEGPEGADELLLVIDALAGLLTLMLVVVAGLGVLNAVVLDVRDRVHDIGIHKALGMTPRQTLTAVLSSVVAIGLLGGLVGVPTGVLLHRILLPAMARGAGVALPEVVLAVYGPVLLAAFVLGGVLLAVAGASLPAGWAARARTATALRTE